MRPSRTVALIASLSLLAACGGTPDRGAEPADEERLGGQLPGENLPGEDLADDAQGEGPVGDAPTDGGVSLEDATAAAVDDLAASEGVAPDDVEVVTAERVTWPDGALGCPQPGSMYTQALAPGYRVVLRVAEAEVTYTGGDGVVPTRCDDPVEPAEGAS